MNTIFGIMIATGSFLSGLSQNQKTLDKYGGIALIDAMSGSCQNKFGYIAGHSHLKIGGAMRSLAIKDTFVYDGCTYKVTARRVQSADKKISSRTKPGRLILQSCRGSTKFNLFIIADAI